MKTALVLALSLICALTQVSSGTFIISGIQRKWHPITITYDGPESGEYYEPNPFRNYRLNVIFSHNSTGKSLVVPGYFAADGNSSESGATSGNKWRVHFTPGEIGEWKATASFRGGKDIAMSSEPEYGYSTSFDGTEIVLSVKDTDKAWGRDHRGKGILRYVGRRYLQFDSGEFFLKGGADSPENLLGYEDFDGTFSNLGRPLKNFEPHLQDWKEGDPTWQGGKGKGLIGALNYLASTGCNVFSFLAMNVDGDGQDVWPWVQPYTFDRYDVSKLDQWNKVFTHADEVGLYIHLKTQETENDLLLNNGDLGPERKLYYRELIARFSHHHALNWNLGEENDIWEERDDENQDLIKSYAKYIHEIDPYSHPIIVHSYPVQHEQAFSPLLGDKSEVEGLALQANWYEVYDMTLEWVNRSTESGRPWIVCNDEQNRAEIGVAPDGFDAANRDLVRQRVLWGNLMAGGAGVEYYFGYSFPDTDLDTNNWRTRASKWKDLNHALTFFGKYVPFWNMYPASELSLKWGVFAFGKPGDTIVYYWFRDLLETPRIRIPPGKYTAHFFNPREGGPLIPHEIGTFNGPMDTDIIAPSPADWVLLLRAI